MMEPKPLTAKRRGEIDWIAVNYADIRWVENAIGDLLAAEAYWRNAVKNTNPFNAQDKYGEVGCAFCGSFGELHEDSCPWLKAQEEA